MADYQFAIFAAGNITNPNDPGHLPTEDGTFLSDLEPGEQITWDGGAESTLVTVTDNENDTFDEAQTNQTLTDPVTFSGISYSAGQVVTPTYIINFIGSDGLNYTMVSFNFSANTDGEEPDAVFWETDIPPNGTVLTMVSEVNPTGAGSPYYSTFVTCFSSETTVQSERGDIKVIDLVTGDRVLTRDRGMQDLRLIVSRTLSSTQLEKNPKLRPIRITAGALGQGLPKRDLLVSRQHRMLVSSKIAMRLFGVEDVLVSAVSLTALPGIFVDEAVAEVTYVHLLFGRHEVIFAEGAPTESLFTGPQALKAVSSEAREEIFSIFPELAKLDYEPEPASPIPNGKLQKQLAERHAKNSKPALELFRN